MNIIFEGVNGSGKTTIINAYQAVLTEAHCPFVYISDLVYTTPLSPVLQEMFHSGVFLTMRQQFKTSLFESLVLAANHHFIQEQVRSSKQINIFDRDFVSILAYQKDIIKSEYTEWAEFYEAFRKVVMFQLKHVDLLVYVTVPVAENVRRTEQRDHRKFTQSELDLLMRLKNNMDEEISHFRDVFGGNVLYLDGLDDPKHNVTKVVNAVEQCNYHGLPQ